MGVARASLKELRLDYQNIFRQQDPPLRDKNPPKDQAIRKLANTKYSSSITCVEARGSETAANIIMYLIHQANSLLDWRPRHLVNSPSMKVISPKKSSAPFTGAPERNSAA